MCSESRKELFCLIYKFLSVLLLLCIAYTIILICAMLIDSSELYKNANHGIEILEKEGEYPRYFFSESSWFNSNICRLDNFTDKLILEKASIDTRRPVFEAMHVEGYARYWHGYIAVLRPLLCFLNYYDIRLLMNIVFFLSFFAVGMRLQNITSPKFGITFILSILPFGVSVIPMSLQFFPVFLIAFIITFFMLKTENCSYEKHMLLLTISGSITNFFDLLTVPIITLGYPLITLLIIDYYHNRIDKQNLKKYAGLCICWCIGYGFTWISKWIIGSVLIQKNIVLDAFEQVVYRTAGTTEYLDGSYIAVLERVVATWFTPFLQRISSILLIICIGFAIRSRRIIHSKILIVIYLGIAALMPYAWYFVLRNHSGVHYWFTYRAQCITVFSVLTGLLILTEKKKG